MKDAPYLNSIGAPELSVAQADADFDTDELAFYYLRALEIRAPRWTASDTKFFSLTN